MLNSMKGPDGQKRPDDVVSNAVIVAKIATGEITEKPSRRRTISVKDVRHMKR